MKIAIGVPSIINDSDKNGFFTAFKMIQSAIDSKNKSIVFAPKNGDFILKTKPSKVNNLITKYQNTIDLSKEFARKVKKIEHEKIVAFTNMGLFLDEDFVYYTSNMPYRRILKLIENEYPKNEYYRKLLTYYKFIAEKEKENYLKAKKIITLSPKIKEAIIEEYKINPKKIIYIPRPILKKSKVNLKKDTNSKSIKIIIMPTELRVMKGIKYAIETMKILKKKMPNAVLVICGKVNAYEKDYINFLLKEAKKKANIICTGFLPKEKLYQYMQEADCAFMPFCFDESPIALNECLIHCLPVVTNEYAGYHKKVINKFGYCAKYKDTKDLAKGLLKILRDKRYNEKKRKEIKKLKKEFTVAKFQKEINKIFQLK